MEAQNFIGGEWVSAAEMRTAVNPATGETIGTLPKSDAAAVDCAVASAHQAARRWARTPVFERAATCTAIARAMDQARERIARTLSREQGKPFAEAVGEVAKGADGFRLAGELVKQMGGQTFAKRLSDR